MLDLIDNHTSTIVFTNSRRLAERLTARLNDLARERDPDRVADIRGPSAPSRASSASWSKRM